MKRSAFIFVIILLFSGCQEGIYNRLSCDESLYQPECLDDSHYMMCLNHKLTVVSCPENARCDVQSVSCKTDNVCQTAVCQDTQTLLECQNGQTVEVHCSYGCAQGQCRKDNVLGCIADQCRDGQTLLKCMDGEIHTYICPLGCENNACIESSASCVSSVCLDDKRWLQCEQGKGKTRVCPAGCAENSCITLDPCQHITCDQGICERGVCVTDAMAEIQAGSTCDYATFQEFCRQDAAVYCHQGMVVEESCPQGCSIVDIWGTSMAFCTGDTSDCTTPNQPFSYCQHYDDGTQAFDYESLERCVINSEGQYTRLDMADIGIMDTCDDLGCDSAKQHCQTPIAPLVCAFETSCDGEVFQFCQETFLGVWAGTEDCAEQNMTCGWMEGTAACRISCSTPDTSRTYCQTIDSQSYQVHSVCTMGDDLQAYEVMTYTACPHGCDETTSECIKLTETEGQRCAAEEFSDRCENDVAILCIDGIIEAENCAELGENYTCRIAPNGKRQCIEKCTEPDHIKTQCETVGAWDVTYTYQCTETENNIYYYLLKDYEICSGHCNATSDACLKLLPEEGEFCDSFEFSPYCSDNILGYCEDNSIFATDCAASGAVCETIDGTADCYAGYDICDNVGAIDTYCMETDWYGAVTYHYICSTADSGISYWALTHLEQCRNGYGACNTEGTACE